jgi:lipopolysaccharide/colanic/teichoic acid biosynthesis glycosyltransferase
VGRLRRAIDILVSACLLTVLSPLLTIVAILIKCTSRGPVIYAQARAGLGGRPFRFYKFRSMYPDADARLAELHLTNEKDGPIFKMKRDPRVTPLGRVIRRLSIDELPQLWNVLIGDMTLVGPRPPTLNEVASYEPWQRERLGVTGGLTCIWQVSGRSELSFEQWVRMDLRYIRRRSLWLDLSILRRTFGAVLSGRGAY